MLDPLVIEPLTAVAFQSFGEVLEVKPQPTVMINEGRCARYSDLAQVEFLEARAGISVFKAQLSQLPFHLRMMERHPLGSQAFIPMSCDPFLVIVAQSQWDTPKHIKAFITDGKQGVNYLRNTWHAVLTPLSGDGLFTVVDRIGDGSNLEECWFDEPFEVRY